MERKSKLIVDETTIYEVDLECFQCLSEEDRQRYYGDDLTRRLQQEDTDQE